MKNYIILLLVFLIVGCSNDVLQADTPSEEQLILEAHVTNHIMDTNYTTEKLNLINYGIKDAGGMVVLNDKLVISDSVSSKLYFFDMDYNLESELKIDAGLGISRICANDSSLYILDTLLGTIHVLEIETYTEIKQIALPKIAMGTMILDMCLIEDSLYLSLCNPNRESSGIWKININTEENEVLDFSYKDNSGYIDLYNGELYYANLLELSHQKGTTRLHVGNNVVGKVTNGTLYDPIRLVEGSTPGDFIINDSEIIVYSVSWHSVDRYDRKGRYISTLSYIEDESLENVLISLDDECLLLLVGTNVLHRIHKGDVE